MESERAMALTSVWFWCMFVALLGGRHGDIQLVFLTSTAGNIRNVGCTRSMIPSKHTVAPMYIFGWNVRSEQMVIISMAIILVAVHIPYAVPTGRFIHAVYKVLLNATVEAHIPKKRSPFDFGTKNLPSDFGTKGAESIAAIRNLHVLSSFSGTAPLRYWTLIKLTL